MPATAKKRVSGRQVEVVVSKLETGAEPLTDWTKFSAETSIGEDEATAASSEYEQFSPGVRKATMSVEGFVGSNENMENLPQEGDEIKTIGVQTITEGSDLYSRLADPDKYGKWVVTKTRYEQTGKPSTWGFDARSGATI